MTNVRGALTYIAVCGEMSDRLVVKLPSGEFTEVSSIHQLVHESGNYVVLEVGPDNNGEDAGSLLRPTAVPKP